MKFKEFELDPFQEQAIEEIDKGNSVIVSAATGTGKTLIADYIIDKYLKLGKKIIYTAPIKALSNQKYRDFITDYGYSNIGLMTGDVVINPEAPVLIMTTEIYRNMLVTRDSMVNAVSYVIFDEIHFISDIERGTVWEESIIFSPEHVRFLCLSATIPNARQFGDWIMSIKDHTVAIVKYDKRAVPLEHFVYDKMLGVTTLDRLDLELTTPDYDRAMRNKKQKKVKIAPPMPGELIGNIKGNLPCLFFVFSRIECEKKATLLARDFNFLNGTEKAEVASMASELIPGEFKSMESIQRLKNVLPKGIAFHHAGMLPFAKELVEKLFAKSMIKVLFATETFAVGINMPAKSVAFASMYKFDGMNFRLMTSQEYFQMAGRAGRRGIDKVGSVYIMINRNEYDSTSKLKKITTSESEPIISQFRLSYNTVINLVNNYQDDETRELILKSSFDYFQRKQEKNIRIKASYKHKMRILEKLGFIQDNTLTEKGHFSRRIYDKELLVTELFCGHFYKQLSAEELIILSAAIVYESGRNDSFETRRHRREAKGLGHFVKDHVQDPRVLDLLDLDNITKLYHLTKAFLDKDDFQEVMKLTTLQEGDVIRLFRRSIDLMRQIKHATTDYDLMDKISICINKLEKMPVRVDF